MTTGPPPICVFCKHLQKGLTCKVLGVGIPDDILSNKHDHRDPYEGDRGFRFTPRDSRAANDAKEYMREILDWHVFK